MVHFHFMLQKFLLNFVKSLGVKLSSPIPRRDSYFISLQCAKMTKSCLWQILLYLNFIVVIAEEDKSHAQTFGTNFTHGFGDWQVTNHSWVAEKWTDIQRKSNQTFPDPTVDKSVSEVSSDPSIINPSV